jgi:hypothetical protein
VTPLDDDLLRALSAARPIQTGEPTAASPQAQAMLTRILETGAAPTQAPRSRSRRRFLIGVPAGIAAAAAGFALVQAPGKSARPRPIAVSSAPVDLRTAVLAAFDSASGSISHSVSTWRAEGSPNVTFERWAYPAFAKPGQRLQLRQLLTAGGRPDQDVAFIFTVPDLPAGLAKNTRVKGELIDVEHATGTWSDQKNTGINPPIEQGPEQIRQQIADGHFTVRGKVSLNGREAIELNWSPGGSVSRLWVDAATYLPLKSSFDSKVGRPGHYIDSGEETRFDTLPATKANLALLSPPIPAGFKQTVAPPEHPGG